MNSLIKTWAEISLSDLKSSQLQYTIQHGSMTRYPSEKSTNYQKTKRLYGIVK